MTELTHLDINGHVRMVDVGDKPVTDRIAIAGGRIGMTPQTFELIVQGGAKKGNVLETARIAGVMAAKKTAELIPMCHPLAICYARVDFLPCAADSAIDIEAEVRVTGTTGVEMEALTAISISALTIYDMCKAYDRAMTISDIRLKQKSGGKSGLFIRKD